MFRKITHIVLGIFLIIATTGLTVSMHFCGGEIISVSINKEAKTCCNGSGRCCENKTFHIEVEDDYVSPLIVENSKILSLEVLFPIFCVSDLILLPEGEKAYETFTDTSPPPKIQIRLSLLQTYLC